MKPIYRWTVYLADLGMAWVDATHMIVEGEGSELSLMFDRGDAPVAVFGPGVWRYAERGFQVAAPTT